VADCEKELDQHGGSDGRPPSWQRVYLLLKSIPARAKTEVAAFPRATWRALAERSLVGVAARSKRRLAIATRLQRLGRGIAAPLWHFARSELSCIPIALLAIGGAFWPIHASLEPFASTDRAAVFLQALWQVEGVTLAIALTVVVFVFATVYSSRIGGSLRQFAEETGLFPIFYVGLVSLGLDAVVLLGGGEGASGGWAATWAAVWGGLDGLLLGVLFVSTIRAIEISAMERRRLARARREVQRETERVILKRIALNSLLEYGKRVGFEYTPIFGTAPTATAVAITARRSGEIADIRLRPLNRLSRLAKKQGVPPPRLAAQLDQRVGADTELLWVEPQALRARPRPRARHAFKLRRKNRELAFRETIERLRDETIRAIDPPSPSLYVRLNEVYEEMLLALPATWAEYGQEFGPGIAGEATPFELGFLDLVERDLYVELEQAVLGRSRDVDGALAVRASALSMRMLALWAAIIGVLIRAPDSDSRNALLDRAAQQIGEYGRFSIERLIEEGDADERERAARALFQLFEAVTEVCKRILDHDPGQTALLGKFNAVFDKFLVHWQPEHEPPQQWDLDAAEQQGLAVELDGLRARFHENQEKVAVRDRVQEWRDIDRFVILFWILRNIRDTGSSRWREAWEVFAPYLGDVPRLGLVLDKAIEADFRDRGRWSRWILESFNDEQAHAVGADGDLIQTFIVRALQIIAPSPDAPPPEIEPMEWTRGRLEDPAGTVRALVEDHRFAPLLPTEELEARIDLLISALVEANRRRDEREDETIMRAQLSATRVNEFEEAFRRSWGSERWCHRALAASGAIREMAGNPLESVSGSEVRTWIPKGLLIEDARIAGADMNARQYGVNLAHHENHALADLISATSPHLEAEEGVSAGDHLRAVIRELRDAGFAPDFILVPLNFRLVPALDIQMARARGGDVDAPQWIDEGQRRIFLGTIDDVGVFELHHPLEERILIADLAAFVEWQTWMIDGEELLFRLTAFDEVEAERVARENPELFAGEGDSLSTRATAVRLSLLFLAQVRYERVVRNPEAARSLGLPEGLRRR
jgi:hypothetical protein